MNIQIIRHTPVKLDDGICYGFSDIDIKDNYLEEFKKIKDKLELTEDTIIYSSPLKRCKLLAEFLSPTPVYDDRLKELNFGDWESKKWDEIKKDDLKSWGDNFVTAPCPNGEAYIDLHKRALHFLYDISKKDHENIILITHGGVIRSFLSYLLDFPLENAFRVQIDYSSVTNVKIDGNSYKVFFVNR